jgi:hypothetical protein
LIELAQTAQDGTLQALQVCPTKVKPEEQLEHTLADVQLAQLLIWQAKHALLKLKKPILQAEH